MTIHFKNGNTLDIEEDFDIKFMELIASENPIYIYATKKVRQSMDGGYFKYYKVAINVKEILYFEDETNR